MSDKALVFVGSMTRPTPYFETAEGEGISVLLLDEETGELTAKSHFAGVDNPSFISVDRNRKTIYAVSEVYGWNEGTVTALSYDPLDGRLRYINKQATQGSCTAHSSFDRTGKFLFTTNYAHEKWEGHYNEDTPRKAVCVFPLRDDGWIEGAVCTAQHHGSGPVPGRQAEPHPHCAMASPDNRFVLVADLGLDAVMSYRFDSGVMTLASSFKGAPGSGPRHLKFAPDGRSIYLINELDSTISHLAFDTQTGSLAQLQTISTLPADFSAENRCSDLQLSPDGRFLYGANRGHDSIAVFAIEPGDGSLRSLAVTPCGGRTPRNLGLSPSGRFLMVANQNSHTVAVFHRSEQSGLIEKVAAAQLGTPMAVSAISL